MYKIDAILRRIKSIRLRDPTSKTLLFTSLTMLINPLCGLLVMPMNSGARGLNLTVANHIIFVEPQMDISQIAQAIGRIDRIGQKKQMIVHHFVVYGSIEEQIYYKYSQDQDKDWTVQSIVHLLGLIDNNEEIICDE
ncbi:unnamed protein product [Onchocerca flexuosa]|uniref:Helicase C-terminal domain-containing protein n=1 Tax=Onchocerca flexuosa TaxID=387005 RepID=A0A183H7U4_9BILA|nr:unnamed protein product [Onchocerca flexuosa]